jgi:NAD(P)H-hydrate epimerase
MGASLSRLDVRNFDRWAAAEAGLPTRVLMESAGRGAAEILLRLGIHGPVVVCAAKGNNGGDGLVVARWLRRWNVDVSVRLFAKPEELRGDVADYWTALLAAGVPAMSALPLDEAALRADVSRAEWVVDALFGIGLVAPARPPFDRVISLLNASPARIFAIDIPSGLDADTGEPQGPTIRAKHTATMAAAKKGFGNPGAAHYTGRVHVVDLGIG